MDAATRAYFETLGTMERLFLAVENELKGEPLQISVTYDSTYGFPTEISSDPSETTDEELYLVISDFAVLP